MRYKGSTPVMSGDKVDLLTIDGEVWAEAKVIDAMASQFTCRIGRQKTVRYFFYADRGVTWTLK